MNPLKKLQEHGQSIWLDYIRRSLITRGELARLIEHDGLKGMTSNPTIFEKSISEGTEYDDSLRRALGKKPGQDAKTLFETIAIEDIQLAADVLRPVFDGSKGRDGFVSLEVSPELANDIEGTVAEARRLWKAVNRPNIMIKVPGTKAGVPAFEQLIGEGININVTLMFSLDHYESVAQAYIRGLKRCKTPEKVASVASFFVSRVDTYADKALEGNGSKEALALRGKIAVANAKLTYRRFEEIFHGDAFAGLKAKGCRVQRPLWASTSTKNPEYRDVLYVEELIGPETVNTLPPQTLEAFREHGRVDATLVKGVDEAAAQIAALEKFGIDFREITEKLQVDGVAAFAKSYRELLEALKKKRKSSLLKEVKLRTLSLGANEGPVGKRLEAWRKQNFAERLSKKDFTLWSPKRIPELEDRMGWLDLPAGMGDRVSEITGFAETVRGGRIRHAVLLGMGGSSLAPEVFQRTFGSADGHPELIVLDSTHPDAIRSVEAVIDPARTLFIVSSKSGTTTETLSFFRYFWKRVSEETAAPGRQFIAITDSGTPLESLARERRFRRVFHAPADVGGRYSALSEFGLVPAALIGVDIGRLVGAARDAMARGDHLSYERPSPIVLGAALGELARAGRDKLTISTTASLAALPEWIEQLVAESTGKAGRGIVPVVGESPAVPRDGDDRFFVHVMLEGDENAGAEALLEKLEAAGHPVARIRLDRMEDLGRAFLHWEVAVAAAASVLEIHPFDQPDVQLAKDLAKKAMAATAGRESGWDDGVETIRAEESRSTQRTIDGWLAAARKGDYVGVQAYLAPDRRTGALLGEIREALTDRLGLATTLGYGPRFLHSTGQLHKGGANTGLFLQIVDEPADGLEVPETEYSFRELIRAQALGDASALQQRNRRIVRVVLGPSGVKGLKGLFETALRA